MYSLPVAPEQSTTGPYSLLAVASKSMVETSCGFRRPIHGKDVPDHYRRPQQVD